MAIPKDLIRECPAIDDDCIELCKAINLYKPNIFTTESCCGHGKTPYHIWFKVMNLEILPHILYWMNGCHTGYYGWHVDVKTDCSKQYPTFLIEGPIHGAVVKPINKPIDAYAQASYIAKCICEDYKIVMSARKRDRTRHSRRDRKYKKKRSGMRVNGRSIFTIVDIIIKKAKEIRNDSD